MSGNKAKLLRKVFKDRKLYRSQKKAYRRASSVEKMEALDTLQKIVKSGKKIEVINDEH